MRQAALFQIQVQNAIYARVALERGMDDDGLTYAVPAGLTGPGTPPLSIGERIEVPLGKKLASGIVVAIGGPEILGELDPGRVRAIVRRPGAVLPSALVELAEWMAGYYCAPLGMVLSSMIPSAVKQDTGRRVVEIVDLARHASTPAVPSPEAQASGQTHSSAPELEDRNGSQRLSNSPNRAPINQQGSPEGKREDPSQSNKVPKSDAVESRGLTKARAKLWNAVVAIPSDEFPMSLRALAARVGAKTVAGLRTLAEFGLLTISTRTEISSRHAVAGSREVNSPVQPSGVVATDDQERAIEGILADGFDTFRVHLLRGVTGSGKTEVYLRLIERMLSQPMPPSETRARTAIVLVPEIALTPQTAQRFTSRFGTEQVAVLHSGLTAAQRNREWSRAASGEARVVVGARSAIFAPIESLGLIIVDEEHDSSYKQDQVPRYNARDVAIKRAQLARKASLTASPTSIAGCPIVLGSATPSMESWANAQRALSKSEVHPTAPASPWRLWELPNRVPGARLPRVQIVDLAEERRARMQRDPSAMGRVNLLGPTLEDALERTLHDGGQAIMLLNRRGFAHYVSCPSSTCGFVMSCDQCDATLVMHKALGIPSGRLVKCHHCLAEQLLPELCPSCGRKIHSFGGGTQRLETEIENSFASMGLKLGETMLRLDSDSMRSARDYYDALSRFGRGEVRVLLGTQMIAKGLDFPNVVLVGVIDADTALSIPDFRAEERTFQLVSQVAGRAGRSDREGLVIIQTMKPHNAAIRLAATHDYVAFATRELQTRRASRLPPYARMARIVCRDADLTKARKHSEALAELLRSLAGPASTNGTIVRGPLPCAVSRIAGQFRFGIDVIAGSAGMVQRLLGAARSKGWLKSDAKTAVDVDPVSLM